jgi:ABC-type oligopeptide transport system ATPase subunit
MLRRLSLRDFVIVSELDIELGTGFTALTGETGAGKSTFAKLVARFYDPTDGAVRVDGFTILAPVVAADMRAGDPSQATRLLLVLGEGGAVEVEEPDVLEYLVHFQFVEQQHIQLQLEQVEQVEQVVDHLHQNKEYQEHHQFFHNLFNLFTEGNEYH